MAAFGSSEQRCSRSVKGAGWAACILLFANDVAASPELPAQYDARSVGMAGTGVSFLHNGAAVFHNPASLDGIEKFSVTAVASPFMPKVTVPVEGPDDKTSSEFTLVPLFLAGAGFRVAEPIVLGLAVYPQTGFGASFDDVQALGGEDMELTVAVLEAAPAISVRIAEGFSLGASYRITYAQQTTKLVVPLPDPVSGMLVPTTMEGDLSGTNFAGFMVGANYAATDDLGVAATFRSKVATKVSGDTTMNGVDFDTESEIATPHRVMVGAHHEFMDDRLTLAANFKYLFYSGAMDEVETTMTIPMVGDQTTTQKFGWKNVAAFALGAEYLATDTVPVRLGYSLSQSATPEKYANAFVPSPALIHGVHAGAGVRMENVDVDLGGQYVFQRGEYEPDGSLPGEYNFDAFVVSLSATYHM